VVFPWSAFFQRSEGNAGPVLVEVSRSSVRGRICAFTGFFVFLPLWPPFRSFVSLCLSEFKNPRNTFKSLSLLSVSQAGRMLFFFSLRFHCWWVGSDGVSPFFTSIAGQSLPPFASASAFSFSIAFLAAATYFSRDDCSRLRAAPLLMRVPASISPAFRFMAPRGPVRLRSGFSPKAVSNRG